jgi:HemY protein
MCVRVQLWGKAREYLERSIALDPSAAAWEALGDAFAGQGDTALAQRSYRNALLMARGEATAALPESYRPAIDTRSVAVEERNAHGVPRLPL